MIDLTGGIKRVPEIRPDLQWIADEIGRAKKINFIGIPLSEMTKDELMAVIGHMDRTTKYWGCRP